MDPAVAEPTLGLRQRERKREDRVGSPAVLCGHLIYLWLRQTFKTYAETVGW